VSGRFSCYPAYRPSGIEWIGDIPSHWIVAALTYRYHVQLGKMLDEKRITGNHLAPYLRNTDVQWNQINFVDLPLMDFDAGDRRRYSLRKGDLLVCEGGEVGRAAIWDGPIAECYYQKALHRVRPKFGTEVTRFLLYALRAAASAGALADNTGKATIDHLPAERLRMIRFPFASTNEQSAIATFLDRKTAKIDALIETKKRLIKLVEEKWQAVIARAVTKGLDPKVAVKHSGVDLLGDVPSHWDVKPLMFLTDQRRPIMYGIVLPGPDVDDGVLIVKGGDVKPGRLAPDKLCRTTREIEARYARSRLRAGDLVYSIRGSVGEVEVVPSSIEGANLTQDAARIAPRTDIYGHWLLFVMRSNPIFRQLEAGMTGAAVPGINIGDLKRVSVPCPPPDEQRQIATYLMRRAKIVDDGVRDLHHAIDLLQHHRSSLIAAAVTGKIDVRGQSLTVSQSDRGRLRVLVAAEVTHRHQGLQRFGRVKLQKLLYLAEAHAGIHELREIISEKLPDRWTVA
jgi:type I restriction enzyme S subunit